MMKHLKNKKGSIQDIFFFVAVILSLALFFILTHYITDEVSDELLKTKLNESEAARTALGSYDDLGAQYDSIWFFLFIGILIGVLISSFMIRAHPIFIPVYILLLGFAVVIGAIMNNVYLEFTATSVLAATAATHVYSNAIINNYVQVIIGVGILSMIIIFAKPRGERL